MESFRKLEKRIQVHDGEVIEVRMDDEAVAKLDEPESLDLDLEEMKSWIDLK